MSSVEVLKTWEERIESRKLALDLFFGNSGTSLDFRPLFNAEESALKVWLQALEPSYDLWDDFGICPRIRVRQTEPNRFTWEVESSAPVHRGDAISFFVSSWSEWGTAVPHQVIYDKDTRQGIKDLPNFTLRHYKDYGLGFTWRGKTGNRGGQLVRVGR